jgi:cytochrome c6
VRRLRASVVAAVLATLLTLAACGGTDEDGAETAPQTTATPTEANTTETATAEGTTGETTTVEEEGGGDADAGREVFESAGCGQCHTLSAAGSTGGVGPNLDDARPSFDKVVERVTEGKGVMPSFADTLSEEQIGNVAAFVSSSTRGGED